MLGVHRQQQRARLFRCLHHRGARADQGLLVGESDRTSRRNRRESGLEAGRPHDRGHHQIGLAQRRFPNGFRPRRGLDAGPRERRFEIAKSGRIGDRRELGAEFDCGPRQGRAIATAGDRGDREPARRSADYLRARASDRPGRSENRKALPRSLAG